MSARIIGCPATSTSWGMTARVGPEVATRSAAAVASRTRSTETGRRQQDRLAHPVCGEQLVRVRPVRVVSLGGVVVGDLSLGQEGGEEGRSHRRGSELRASPSDPAPRAGRSAARARDGQHLDERLRLGEQGGRSASHSGARRSATTVGGGPAEGTPTPRTPRAPRHRPGAGPARARAHRLAPTPEATLQPTVGRRRRRVRPHRRPGRPTSAARTPWSPPVGA